MDDLIIIDYLKRKGLYNLTEKECDSRLKDIMYQHFMKDYGKAETSLGKEKSYPMTMSRDADSKKRLVDNMFHYEEGKKYAGEKFDIYKTKEVCERYRGIIPSHIDEIDVYIAINAHYHDYAELYKLWFGDNIDQKIIDSAIKFWFKDEDCKHSNKVREYFKEY